MGLAAEVDLDDRVLGNVEAEEQSPPGDVQQMHRSGERPSGRQHDRRERRHARREGPGAESA